MIVIDYKNSSNVTIKFQNTGYITVATAQSIRKGTIRDLLYPRVEGVGYLGGREYTTTLHRPAHYKWKRMLMAHPKTSICEDWYNFQNFAKWFYTQEHTDGPIQKNTLVFDPESSYFNKEPKQYALLDPKGKLYTFSHQHNFSMEHNLTPSSVCKVLSGKRDSHRGWTLPKGAEE